MTPNAGHNEDIKNYVLWINAKEGNSAWAVPLLKFGTGNNWIKYKEKLTTEFLEKYGDLVRLVQTEFDYEPPKIEGTMM